MSTTSRPYTFDRVVRIVAGLALLAGAIWLVNDLRNVLLPFCVACLISYLLNPLVLANQKYLRIKNRIIASLLTILEMTCVIGLLIYFFLPSIIKEVHDLGDILARGQSSDTTIPFIPESVARPVKKWIASFDINDLLRSSHLESIVSSGTSVISSTITFLLHTVEWLLTFIYVIFILIDYRSLMNGFRILVPRKYRPLATRLGNDIKASMNRYFRGQLTIAACAAVLYCTGFSIVGIPLAIILGILVGILYIIPYFQYVTLVPVAIVCFIASIGGNAIGFWPLLGECLLVYVVSQCVCDYILTPKIMGKAMGLNPAIILLSLSVWGTLLGLIGMIIALPLTTLLLAYYQEFINGKPEGSDDASQLLQKVENDDGV